MSTPWIKLLFRIWKARRAGRRIRVVQEIDYHGEPTWMYLGNRQ